MSSPRRQRSPLRERSPCRNPTDYITLESFYNEIQDDDIIYIHTGDNIECYEIRSFIEYLAFAEPMANWVQNDQEIAMDDMGRGGHAGNERYVQLPNGYQWIRVENGDRVIQMLEDGYRHFKALLVDRVRLGNIDGIFGVGNLHGQLPEEPIFLLEEIYEDKPDIALTLYSMKNEFYNRVYDILRVFRDVKDKSRNGIEIIIQENQIYTQRASDKEIITLNNVLKEVAIKLTEHHVVADFPNQKGYYIFPKSKRPYKYNFDDDRTMYRFFDSVHTLLWYIDDVAKPTNYSHLQIQY